MATEIETAGAARDSATQPPPAATGFWPQGWWRLLDMKIGIIPIPIYFILVALIAILVNEKELKPDIPTMIIVLALGGFTCAEIGKRIPVIRAIGAGAIFATFIPSALVYYSNLTGSPIEGWFPLSLQKAVIDFTKFTNFLYFYIATIIVGSILGMDRRVLIAGFLKIFVPLALGSIAAACVGTLVGVLLGQGAYHTFFFIVVPIMAGGVGEGAIPLSIGYASILGQDQGQLFAQVLPPVMLGSLTAIIFAGTLNYVGKKRPELTGNGRLQPGVGDELQPKEHEAKDEKGKPMDVETIAAAGITAVMLYLIGVMAHHMFDFPAPIAMLFLAVLAKLAEAVSPHLQAGGFVVYKFVRVSMTYPLLFAIGVALTPWKELMAAFTLVNLIIIVSTVFTIMAVGFIVGRLMGMYPIETAVVNACHSGQGGTGDVAILTAADRMQLMPFAQIATRIGGALTVTGVLIAMRFLAH